MAKRTVIIDLKRMTDAPWVEGAKVEFRLVENSFTASATYPKDMVAVEVDAQGRATVELWCNTEGLRPAKYTCSLPTGEIFPFTVPAGDSPIALEVLRAEGLVPPTPSNQQIFEVIINARLATHVALIGSETHLGHFKVGAGLAVSSDGTLSVTVTGGVADHGALTGLGDNDHPQYQLRSERNQPSGYIGANINGQVPDVQIASNIVRQSELTSAVNAEALTRANADTALQAGVDAEVVARTAAINIVQEELVLKAPLANPALTGTPTAPTAPTETSSTQIATTAFVHALAATILAAPPSTLDTLHELAAALGNDPNFATTITTLIGGKLAKSANLADLTDPAAARVALQLGTAAMAATADLLNRANHTGSQAINTIAGLQDTLDAKQSQNSNLSVLAGLTPANSDVIQYKAGAWANRTPAQLKADLAIAAGDVLGLGTAALADSVAFAPAAQGVTNGNAHDHVGGDGAAITEGALSLSDVATANASAARHGLLPKLSGSIYDGLRGDGNFARFAQALDIQYAANTNAGAGETTLYTYAVPAGLLSAGKTIRIRCWGTHAANTNSVQLRLSFGATVVISKAMGSSGGRWYFEAEVVATGAATQSAFGLCFLNTGAAATINSNGIDVTSPTETLSGAVVVKMTAQGVATGDVTGAGWKVVLEN